MRHTRQPRSTLACFLSSQIHGRQNYNLRRCLYESVAKQLRFVAPVSALDMWRGHEVARCDSRDDPGEGRRVAYKTWLGSPLPDSVLFFLSKALCVRERKVNTHIRALTNDGRKPMNYSM